MTIGSKKMSWPGRPEEGRILTGVCAGLSRSYEVDVTLLRLSFLLLTFAWGFGLIVYVTLWFAMPDGALSESKQVRYRRNMGVRGRSIHLDLSRSVSHLGESWQRIGRDPWPRPLGRQWLAILLFLGGLIVFLFSIGAFRWLTSSRALGIAVMILGIGIFATLKGR